MLFRSRPEHLGLEHGPSVPDLPPRSLAAARRMLQSRHAGNQVKLQHQSTRRAGITHQAHPAVRLRGQHIQRLSSTQRDRAARPRGHSGMGMVIHQTGHDVPARQPLRAGNRLSDQAPGRVHPQINRPVAIRQRHRAHRPRHTPASAQAWDHHKGQAPRTLAHAARHAGIERLAAGSRHGTRTEQLKPRQGIADARGVRASGPIPVTMRGRVAMATSTVPADLDGCAAKIGEAGGCADLGRCGVVTRLQWRSGGRSASRNSGGR